MRDFAHQIVYSAILGVLSLTAKTQQYGIDAKCVKTRFRAKMCLFWATKPKLNIYTPLFRGNLHFWDFRPKIPKLGLGVSNMLEKFAHTHRSRDTAHAQ